jgi:ABC-type multidrug transport system ATPase subunit
MYAALLKLPKTLSTKDKLEQVEKIIQELRLSHCADTKIGGPLIRGVSGGERRRVSIGIQLLTNPSVSLVKILFCS